MSDSKEIFAGRLRNLIEEKGISQKQLAAETQIAESSISKYLSCDAEPKLVPLANIAKYFDVSVDYLLGISNCKQYQEDMQAVSKFTGLTDEALNFFTSAKRFTPAKRYEIIALSCMLENELWKDVLQSYIRYADTRYNVLLKKAIKNKIESELGDWASNLGPKGKRALKRYTDAYHPSNRDKERQMSALFALSNNTTDLAKAISESVAERILQTNDLDKSVKNIKKDIDLIDREEKMSYCGNDKVQGDYIEYLIELRSGKTKQGYDEWRWMRYGK